MSATSFHSCGKSRRLLHRNFGIYRLTAQGAGEVAFPRRDSDSLNIKVMSFGFKYGVSTESDLVFDVGVCPIRTILTNCATERDLNTA